jgi:perosamine synthetase
VRQVATPSTIPVAGPWITEKEVAYVADAAANAWYQNANVYHERFEAAFGRFVGRRHAVALPSCTAALHLALAGLGVGPGDEVIVPDATWIATAAPISYVGAKPAFADIDPTSWCISPAAVERCLSRRTKAVIAVDLYGGMPDMDGLRAVLAPRGIPLIEDAAESIGSEYRGGKAGSFGTASAFSFHGSKTLTTGEGGMLLTDDDALAARVRVLQDHGRRPGDTWFYNAEVAFKYRMSSLQAALGLAQIERVEELVARKREIFGWYRDGLHGVDGITLNQEPAGTKNSYWMVTAVFDPATGVTKERASAALAEQGIATRPFFHPLSAIPAFAGSAPAGAARARNRHAYDISARAINLPSGFNMTRDLVARVCEQVAALARRPAG